MTINSLLAVPILLTSFSIHAKTYDCIEVNVFEVDRENISSREMARAAEIPDQTLMALQTYVRTELNIDTNGLEALKGGVDHSCDNLETALELKGTVLIIKKAVE